MTHPTNPLAAFYLAAARYPVTFPEPLIFGPWKLYSPKAHMPDDTEFLLPQTVLGRRVKQPEAHVAASLGITGLECWDVVMEDSDQAVRQHLPIWLAAEGSVLVTGLGLGCVVRGLLASQRVTHIDVVEIDADILRVIGHEFVHDQRVALHHADATTFDLTGRRWDYVWHDLWTDSAAGEPHLQLLHSHLMLRYRSHCRRQGAWDFPRQFGRLWNRHGERLLGSPKMPRRAA